MSDKTVNEWQKPGRYMVRNGARERRDLLGVRFTYFLLVIGDIWVSHRRTYTRGMLCVLVAIRPDLCVGCRRWRVLLVFWWIRMFLRLPSCERSRVSHLCLCKFRRRTLKGYSIWRRMGLGSWCGRRCGSLLLLSVVWGMRWQSISFFWAHGGHTPHPPQMYLVFGGVIQRPGVLPLNVEWLKTDKNIGWPRPKSFLPKTIKLILFSRNR